MFGLFTKAAGPEPETYAERKKREAAERAARKAREADKREFEVRLLERIQALCDRLDAAGSRRKCRERAMELAIAAAPHSHHSIENDARLFLAFLLADEPAEVEVQKETKLIEAGIEIVRDDD